MQMLSTFAIFCFISFFGNILALENGLARKPPMGWLSWVAFGCEIDCKKKPDKCISEKQIIEIADRMVSDGYRDAGYEYVIIDDCWLAPERNQQGQLEADPVRFSKGIKYLADYMHSRNLKFGIYEDCGTKTCAGYPGSMGHEDTDANTIASWDVDYLKLDGCYALISELDVQYPLFGKALNATGHPIVYSCEWPHYQLHGEYPPIENSTLEKPNYPAIRDLCNLWRNFYDINPSWSSLIHAIDFYVENQDELASVTGPGAWNDPDMLVIGHPEVTVDHAKVQMAIWSIWSAPLLMSVDLRHMGHHFKEILQNKEVIAINQDPLGIMGKVVFEYEDIRVFVKPVLPKDEKSGDLSYALAFLNSHRLKKIKFSIRLETIGLNHKEGYEVDDLFNNKSSMILKPEDILKTTVNPTGVTMFKATVVT